MEPNEITRINFFDGEFLTQGEFQAEQSYHMYLLRRLLFGLFDGTGVLEIEPGDLRILPVNPPADKTFQVSPGMALSRRADQLEGRTIIRTLNEGLDVFDLAATAGAGQTGFVALHYEEALQDPQTVASPATETRVRERAVISVHAGTWPPATSPPDGEQYVLLGAVAFDDMSVDYSQRQSVRIRSALVSGGGPSPLAPVVTGISPPAGPPGSVVSVTITGSNLAGATVTSSDPLVTTIPGTTSDTAVTFDLDIGATSGPITLTVDTGAAPPDTIVFTVVALIPVVTIAGFTPTATNIQASGTPGTLTVTGSNLRDPGLNPLDPAAGTQILLVDPSNPANTVAPSLANPIVLPDVGGNQRVRVDFPFAGDFSVQLSQVRVTVSFGGGTGLSGSNLHLFYP